MTNMIKQLKQGLGLAMLISSTALAQIQISGNVSTTALSFVNLETKSLMFKGEAAIYGKQIDPKNGSSLMLIDGISLATGIVEFDMAGSRSEGSHPSSRGFLGVAFHVKKDKENEAYDCFYLRAANGRAEDQLQRNHTAQYVAVPSFEWPKLREESPGKYESYVDMVPNEWTHIKVVIKDDRAELYVHYALQPTLIVEGLLGKEKTGGIALWVGPGTDAYFANLKITKLK